MRSIPKEHQIYRHFKGNLYQIVTIAKHSETQEEMVVYRPIYNDTGNWVRPLSMFLSEVDREKYPDATQRYRFTLMDRGRAIEEEGWEPEKPEVRDESSQNGMQVDDSNTDNKADIATETDVKEDISSDTEKTDNSSDFDEKTEALSGGLDPLLEKFLDADSYEEKLDVFYLMKRRGTVDMLRYVAMSLEIEVMTDDFDEMFRQIQNCLKTMVKFECNRLRN